MQDNKPLTTRRNKAHYGDRKMIGNTPAAWVKAGKREDFLTAEEFAEDLYGIPVDHIVFKKPALIE